MLQNYMSWKSVFESQRQFERFSVSFGALLWSCYQHMELNLQYGHRGGFSTWRRLISPHFIFAAINIQYNKENNTPHDMEIDIILLTVTDLLLLYSHIFYRVGSCYFCGGSCSNGGKWNCTCLANVMLCHQLPPNRPCHQWLIPRPSPPWQPHFYSTECVSKRIFEIGARGSDSTEPAPTRSPQIRLRDLINNFDFISNLLFNLFSLFLCLWRIDGFA